jgi:nicotinamide riboside kinase
MVQEDRRTSTAEYESLSMKRLLKIAIVGAECTGKSILAKGLSDYFSEYHSSDWVPEYLRFFVEESQRTPLAFEQILIAREQKALEARLEQSLQNSSKDSDYALLFCDTTPLLTSIYSRVIFGKADSLVDQIAEQHDYDLTLLTQIDLPWVSDGVQRDGPKTQTAVHEMLQMRLKELQIPYQMITGLFEQRALQAQEYVSNLIKQHQI